VAEVATVAGYAIGKAARWLVDLVTPRNGHNSQDNSHSRAADMNGKAVAVVKTVAVLIALSICVPGSSRAQAAAPAKTAIKTPAGAAAPATLPTVEQQIAASVQALPKEMQGGAMVMGYRTKDKLEVIRAGKNGMTCLALFAIQKDFHVACYQDSMEPFMARGRELRAQGMKDDKVDTVRFAEVAAGKIKMPRLATMYQIFGNAKSWNAATGKITDASTLTVIYIPGATPESTGLSLTPAKSGPWMMHPGTPKAHIMLSGSMAP
jgi:hypothetical protein